MLRTRLCELVGIDVPLIQAGMSLYTSPELAAAVSEAGALGSLGQTVVVAIEVRPATVFDDVRVAIGSKRPDASVCWRLSHRT